MANTGDNFDKVARFLSAQSAKKSVLITRETEIWKDLGIYGDDLYELVKWLHETFGVAPTSGDNVFCYAPTEHTFTPLFPLGVIIRRSIGIERQYKSLTVRRVLEVIDAKEWPPP